MTPRVVLLATLLACASPGVRIPPVQSDGRLVMGTVLEVTLADAAEPGLLQSLFARASELERICSRFDPASALSRLNAQAGRGAQRVPPELARLLAMSVGYARRTDGAFDVTLGPLFELWSEAGRRNRLPDRAELASARARVGSAKIRVRREEGTAELLAEGMSLDLGGIAKGFALDTLEAMLRERGVDSALLSFGQSSVQALGAPSGEPGWRVLLRDAEDGFAGVLTLRDQALSVSGSLGQSFEIEGRRYGHVLDPRSGQPLVTRRLAAVVARSGTQAEALSKGLLVLGEADGIALLERTTAVEGILIDADGARWATSGWADAVRYAAYR